MSIDRDQLRHLFAEWSLGSPDNTVGFVLWRVFHRWQREADRVLAPHDLTHLQFTVLTLVAWLGREGEVATQAQLARFGDVHPMQVSYMLKALEAKGLVERGPSGARALGKRAAVTTAGFDALQQTLPVMVELQAALFGAGGHPGGSLLEALLAIAERR